MSDTGQTLMSRPWTNLDPARLEIDGDETFEYGKYVIGPLERGFGITLGNSLRRVLLSSLPGASITKARIEGVLHEFSTVPGVKEDVTDLLLNLKQVRLKLYTDGPETIKLESIGEGEALAGDIQTSHAVEIINPELVLATLSKEGRLSVELTVEWGKGYAPAEESEDAIGTLALDAVFSPIRKVSYKVTDTRVGRNRL